MTTFTDLNFLEVHNYKALKWKSLIAILISGVVAVGITFQIFSKQFWINFRPLSSWAFAILGLAIYAIIYWSKSIFEYNKVVLRIDKQGLWTPKYKLLRWENIWYF